MNRAGVPRPSAASDMGRGGVHIGGDGIGFDAIALRVRFGPRLVDRVQEPEQSGGAVALVQLRQGHHGPGGGMRILSPVLADPRRVAADIARVDSGAVAGRREKRRQAIGAVHQQRVDGHHGQRRAFGVCG